MQQSGRVVETYGKFHRVWDGERTVQAFPGGRLALSRNRAKNLVAIGDRVRLRHQEDGTALIEAVEERANAVSRRLSFSGAEQIIAANVDVLAVMLAPNPGLNTGLLDRTLVECSRIGVPAAILVNKMDLLSPREVKRTLCPYEELGFPNFLLCAKRGDGVDEFIAAMRGRWVLLLGHSGVGKTTLVNRVAPGLDRTVGEVDPTRGKGRHTTSNAYAHGLPDGTFLVDTAGIREFGLAGMGWRELERAFPEIHAVGEACRFQDCRHLVEPRCAVRSAAEEGSIHPARYESYLTLLSEVEGQGRE
ncbi:MAG: ribosome small subunit-dependent GTPase A [Acidobacteriota bacterium]